MVPHGGRPRHYGGQVEPEPIDMHLCHPVLEAVQNESADDGVVAIDGVAAAAVIVILAARGQHIVHPVVQAPAHPLHDWVMI